MNVVGTDDHSSRVAADQCPICGPVSFIRRGGPSLGVGGGIMGRGLVWPFFFFSLSFIFPVIMSALQYLMTAHLFRQFQVAPLEGEGDSGGRGTVFCVGFFVSFFDVIVLKRRGAW